MIDIETSSFEQVIAFLQKCDDVYFNSVEDDQHTVDDATYDRIKEYARSVEPHHQYFVGVGAAVRGSAIALPYAMGSLTQMYIGGDVDDWASRFPPTEKVIITHKYDGVSLLLVYDAQGILVKAFSRGDGLEGFDWTRHVLRIKSIPKQVSYPNLAIRAEIIMKKRDFEVAKNLVKNRAGKIYKTPRNMVAGIMNSHESVLAAYDLISCVAYEIMDNNVDKLDMLGNIRSNGFTTAEYVEAQLFELSDEFLSSCVVSAKQSSEYELDGVVVDLNDAGIRSLTTPTRDTLNPEYARKFKITQTTNKVEATVIGVEYNLSKDGYYKPRVNLKPVQLLGVTVQYATGFNAKFIVENNINTGAVVELTRAGEVTPRILKVIKPADTPAYPDGPYVWNTTNVDLTLPEGIEHEDVELARLVYFFNKLEVEHFDEGSIKTVFDAGFSTPEAVLALDEYDLGCLLHSTINGKKAYKSIREKLTNVDRSVIMAAYPSFGRGIGIRKFEKLLEGLKGDLDALHDVDHIASVAGFNHKTAEKVVQGIDAFEEFLIEMGDRITIKPYVEKKAVSGVLSGFNVVFTEVRSKQAEARIIELGGRVGSSVSSKTKFVIADNEDSTSTKATKARSLGIDIITMSQFWERVGE